MIISVRYFAGARAAAGVEQEQVRVPDGTTVGDLVSTLGDRHGPGLGRVLTASSFLLDGVAVRNRGIVLTDSVEMDVLPPFAGG